MQHREYDTQNLFLFKSNLLLHFKKGKRFTRDSRNNFTYIKQHMFNSTLAHKEVLLL